MGCQGSKEPIKPKYHDLNGPMSGPADLAYEVLEYWFCS